MMFEEFAAQHGLIIKSIVMGKWVRVPTTDHPHSRNGAYFYEGDSGAIQNWAVHSKPIPWRPSEPIKIDRESIRQRILKHEAERRKSHAEAAKRAAYIMNGAGKSTHPYLAKKGFPDEKIWVWNNMAVIPMRINGSLVGCQLIDKDGNKRFLTGQNNKGAVAVFDNKGREILCEGYATALSVRRALRANRTRYKLIVCFSAGNMLEVAKSLPKAVVVADNDSTGVSTAVSTGKPYWVSDVDGEDFNDAELRMGAQSAGMSLLADLGRWIFDKD